MKTYFSKYFVLIAVYTFAIGLVAVNLFQPQPEFASTILPECVEVGLRQECELPNGVPHRPTVIPGAGVNVDPSKTVLTRPRRQAMVDAMSKTIMNEMSKPRR